MHVAALDEVYPSLRDDSGDFESEIDLARILRVPVVLIIVLLPQYNSIHLFAAIIVILCQE